MTQRNRQVQLFASPVKFLEQVEFEGPVTGLPLGASGPELGGYRRQSGFYTELKVHDALERTGNRDVTVLRAGWYMKNNRSPAEWIVGQVVRLTGRNVFITGPWA